MLSLTDTPTMAPFDAEKSASDLAQDNAAHWPRAEAPPVARRRRLPWLAVLAVLILFFTVGITTGCRPAAASTITTSKWLLQFDPARPESKSHAIRSRAWVESATATTSAAAPTRTVLKTFEVDQPVLMPDGPAESDGSTRHGKDYSPELCTVLLMRHDFAWSYGAPFVGNYTPPNCEFNRVLLNFSAVSQGRQYDRLAIMYFGDTEVWRTSTAQPTVPPGISWIYLKDMTHYMYFWKSPQKIIFDLGNLIDDRYTGIFNTTMTAIFYNSDVVTDQAPPSDLIIPISARQGANNSVSQFTLPAENATNTISFPRNVRRAVFSVSANGQATEEFWWSNVLQRDVNTFNDTSGQYPGYSPFREVQVLIDGQIAGAQWPFPVIFTGGVVPSLHRPIVGINAFDLREHEIDITPFLPVLCDGADHTFTIRVAGVNDTPSVSLTETVNESWYVTGKIFVWLDEDPSSITTGEPPTILDPEPIISINSVVTTTPNGTNETLHYTTSVRRSLRITTRRLKTQHSTSPASWSQSISYTNAGTITAFGFDQINDLLISGEDESSFSSSPSHSHSAYRAAYRYPLFANSTYAISPQGNLSIRAHVIQGKQLAVSGPSIFPTGLEAFRSQLLPLQRGGPSRLVAKLRTTKAGTAEFRQSGDAMESTGWGESRQEFWFGVGVGGWGVDGGGGGGDEKEKEQEEEGWEMGLYSRDVAAVNGTVVHDDKWMMGGERRGAYGVGDQQQQQQQQEEEEEEEGVVVVVVVRGKGTDGVRGGDADVVFARVLPARIAEVRKGLS
ncbi:hypothetical protein VTK26DRAFT_4397 [Humicola hyalothermophila]